MKRRAVSKCAARRNLRERKVHRLKQPRRPFHLPLAHNRLERLTEILRDRSAERGAVAAEEACERGDTRGRARRVALPKVVADDVTEADLVRAPADALLPGFRHRHYLE